MIKLVSEQLCSVTKFKKWQTVPESLKRNKLCLVIGVKEKNINFCTLDRS